MLIEKGLLLGSSFLFAIVLTRYWSVTQLGEYHYIIALLALLAPFSNLGLNSLVSRELVNRPEHTAEIIGTAIIMRLGGAFTGAVIFSILSFWLILPSLQPLFFALLSAQITHALGVIDYYFEAKVQSKVSAIIRTTVGLGFMLLKLFFVINGANLSTVLVLTIIEWVLLAAMWLLVYQIYHRGLLHLTWNTNQARFYLRRCGWLIMSSIAAVVYLKIDQVMLGMMVSIEQVAFYSLASRLSEVWYLVPGIVVASFYPALIKLKSSEENGAYSTMLQRMCDYLCWGLLLLRY
ncbi:oligosaccharide flippase family protein [Shewanella aestuarii]|uniref:Oligosaccharide flippase family protein n=1 Tax=Shewanella aestuarii TaxID=1028752 RepID=A0A6G9QKL7_9GAMM|nr:oligosaccharide flippase family protein [Shewanella aestuarii]